MFMDITFDMATLYGGVELAVGAAAVIAAGICALKFGGRAVKAVWRAIS
jgi:hypothetical protein